MKMGLMIEKSDVGDKSGRNEEEERNCATDTEGGTRRKSEQNIYLRTRIIFITSS